LSAHEVDQLFKLVRSLRDRGVSILFIGHRLEEVLDLADRVTVFRDGCWISTKNKDEVKIEEVIHDMVGRDVDDFFVKEDHQRGQLLMSVKELCRDNAFQNIAFDVYRGEVLGFAGLIGSRRTDVGLALFGIAPANSGKVILKGKELTIRSPQQALREGIAYASEDRRQLGLIMPMSVSANITLPLLKQYQNSFGIVKRKDEAQTAISFRDRLEIHLQSIQDSVMRLSGGNQQKVMISKWLNTSPEILILDEPTRGVDVGAKAEVHRMINDLTARGIAVILISSDLPEVLAMSDRVLVMREGRQMGIFEKVDADQEKIMAAAMGQNNMVAEVA